MKKQILGLIGGALLLLGFARTASAGSGLGYVCTTFDSQAGSLGNSGGVLVNFYTGPSCTGNFVAGGYVCTTGATYSLCATNYLRDEAQLMSLYGNIQRAEVANQHVYVSLDGSGNIATIYFYAAGY